MSNQFLKLRRSAVPGRTPTTSSLDFGEIALNTYDGLAFIKKSGSSGEEIIAIGANTSTIFGSSNFIPIFSGSNALITSSIFQSGSFTSIRNATAPEDPTNPDILYVNGDGVNTYNIISAHGSRNGYIQTNVQNYSTGGFASSDVVATSDNGDETIGYIDMGINGSNYASPDFVGAAGDAYMYSTGNDLYIGNASAGRQVIIFNGGLDAINNAKIFIHDQGTISINTDQYNTTNPPSLAIQAPNASTNILIDALGSTDQYIQLGLSNANAGQNASADIAAYNDIDPTNKVSGFIDMGISSTNYNDPTNYPGWQAGHSYLYTDAPGLKIGSTSGSSQVNIFAGGINPITNSKLILRASNIHSLTGSLQVTGSVTGSSDFLINGITVGRGPGNISSNTVIGFEAAKNLTTSPNHVVIGYQAGYNLTTAFSTAGDSVAIGYQAGYNQTQAYNNVYIGYKAGFSNQTAISNTFIGNASGLNTIGRFNTFVGDQSGKTVTTGEGNTFIGSFNTSVLNYLITSGSNNTILGRVNVIENVSNNVILADGAGNIKYRWDATQNNIYGNLAVTGSVTSTTGFTGSLFGTASWAQNAATSSYILNAISASYAATASIATSASFASTASYWSGSILNAVSASYAATASSADNFLVRGTLTAQTIIAQTITSSTDFVTGSTRFGTLLSNTHQFTGSVSITGSLAVNNSSVILSNQTGSMSVATASFANNAVTSSYILNAVSASFASTASYVVTALTASYVTASNVVGTVTSASYAATASYISASNVVGLSLSQITLGVVTASVNAGSNVFNIISGSNTLVVVDNTGSVGIGTTSPAYKLDVNGTARVSGAAILGGITFGIYAQGSLRIDATFGLITIGAAGAQFQHFISNTGGTAGIFINSAGQLKVGANGSTFNDSAILEAVSTTKGFLPTRTDLTSNISSPAQGLITYLTGSTNEGLWYYSSGSIKAWTRLLNDTGSQVITGSLTATSFTGSLQGTSSWANNAVTSSYILNAVSASFATTAANAVTASYVLNAVSSSFSSTASYILNAVSASFASTASSADNFTVRGTLTAQTIVVQTITSSTDFVTGSTRFGSLLSNTHQFTGSVSITGSLTVANGVNNLTASNASNAISASYATTASYVLNAISSSFASTASYAVTSSYVLNAVSSSYAATASYANSPFDIGLAEFNSTSSATAAGTTTVSSIATGSFTSAFYNYTIASGSNARAGQVMSVWSGGTIRYTEVTTTDIGNTATASFAVAISGANVNLSFTAPGVWTVKSIANLL